MWFSEVRSYSETVLTERILLRSGGQPSRFALHQRRGLRLESGWFVCQDERGGGVPSNSRGLIEIQWINSQQAVVCLHGDFSMVVAASLRKKLLQLAKKNPKTLVLDMSAIHAMDTAGVAVLVELYRVLEERGGRLSLVGLRDQLKKMVQLTHLDQLLDLCNSVEAALSKDQRHQDGCS
jgi:anti-anti-sigma factor